MRTYRAIRGTLFSKGRKEFRDIIEAILIFKKVKEAEENGVGGRGDMEEEWRRLEVGMDMTGPHMVVSHL